MANLQKGGNDSVNQRDAVVGESGDAPSTLQESSPFQTAGGLLDVRSLNAGSGNDAPALPRGIEIAQADTRGDSQQDIQRTVAGDGLAQMITMTGKSEGMNFAQLSLSNPELAAAVSGVAERLSKLSPAQMNDTMKVMRDVYATYDSGSGESKDLAKVLRQDKLLPDAVGAVFDKAQDLLRLTPQQRAREIRQIRQQLREFHSQ